MRVVNVASCDNYMLINLINFLLFAFFYDNLIAIRCIRKILKSGSRSSSASNALNLFPWEWSCSLQFLFFFSEPPFYGNYSTLDSHTNTVISHAFAYSSRWRRKPWQGLLGRSRNGPKRSEKDVGIYVVTDGWSGACSLRQLCFVDRSLLRLATVLSSRSRKTKICKQNLIC